MSTTFHKHSIKQRFALQATAGFLAMVMAGCQEPAPQPVTPVAVPPTAVAKNADPEAEKQKQKEQAAGLLEQVGIQLKNEAVADARRLLDELKPLAASLEQGQRDELAELESQWTTLQEKMAAAQRDAQLEDAKKFLADGNLEEAARKLGNVLNFQPTPEQKLDADKMNAEIEVRRRLRRELQGSMQLLASKDRREVRAGQQRLVQDADDAIPLLLEAAKTPDPVLVANALETLRKLNQPQRTMTAMVSVLAQAGQAESWPAAIKEIRLAAQPGAGNSLLELALSAKVPQQRAAALEALAVALDPPEHTVVSLLPLIYQDGPELTPALGASLHAVERFRQFDLAARRGLDTQPSANAEQQLAGLRARLDKIIAQSPAGQPMTPAARAAMTLAIATGMKSPPPLTGVKIHVVSGEEPDGLAAALIDGGIAVEPKSMWRHPQSPDRPGTVILDLGEERTVAGIRIWNLNYPGYNHRGWKELEVFVSEGAAAVDSSAIAIIPPAPGAPDQADYSSLVTVPLVRGRYVKLQCRSLWREEGQGGLSEIQILGF